LYQFHAGTFKHFEWIKTHFQNVILSSQTGDYLSQLVSFISIVDKKNLKETRKKKK